MRPRIDRAELLRRRLEAGLSQAALADQAGVTFSCIAMIERGERGGSPDVMRKVADVLGCNVADIIEIAEAAS